MIFDCDGVVVDSEPVAFDLLGRDFAEHGLTLVAAGRWMQAVLGLTMANVRLRGIELGADLPEGLGAAFLRKALCGAGRGRGADAGSRCRCSMRWTRPGSPMPWARTAATARWRSRWASIDGLMARFKGGIWSGQEMPHPKPAPDLYLHAAAQMGVAPADCVVVEDSPNGARAAIAAGMRCFGLSAEPNAALAAVGAEPLAHLADLPALLCL